MGNEDWRRGQIFSCLDLWKHSCCFFLVFVARFHIYFEKPIKLNHFSTCNKFYFWRVWNQNFSLGLFCDSGSHLRSDGSLPDKLIEFFFTRVGTCNVVFHVGRSDTFMSLLCSLWFGCVMGYFWVFRTVFFCYLLFDCVDCKFWEIYRVGSHVGDESCFIELLSNLHGPCYREPKLSTGFLLKGWCRKRCWWTLFSGFNFDVSDSVCGGF